MFGLESALGPLGPELGPELGADDRGPCGVESRLLLLSLGPVGLAGNESFGVLVAFDVVSVAGDLLSFASFTSPSSSSAPVCFAPSALDRVSSELDCFIRRTYFEEPGLNSGAVARKLDDLSVSFWAAPACQNISIAWKHIFQMHLHHQGGKPGP